MNSTHPTKSCFHPSPAPQTIPFFPPFANKASPVVLSGTPSDAPQLVPLSFPKKGLGATSALTLVPFTTQIPPEKRRHRSNTSHQHRRGGRHLGAQSEGGGCTLRRKKHQQGKKKIINTVPDAALLRFRAHRGTKRAHHTQKFTFFQLVEQQQNAEGPRARRSSRHKRLSWRCHHHDPKSVFNLHSSCLALSTPGHFWRQNLGVPGDFLQVGSQNPSFPPQNLSS